MTNKDHLPLGFEVKQLEWVKHGDRDYQSALTDFGVLYVADAHGWRVLDQWFGVHDIDAAKAAAQSDFERRVRECLVDKPVDGAAVTKPVTNIDSRTPKEVFDIMCDRIRALSAEPVHSAALAQGDVK